METNTDTTLTNCQTLTTYGDTFNWCAERTNMDPWQFQEFWSEMFGDDDHFSCLREEDEAAWYVERYVHLWLDDKV